MDDTLHILGAGSLGLLLAARLAPSVLIRRPGDCPPELRYVLEEAGRQTPVTVPQVAGDRLATPIRRLVVCTKAYDAAAAVRGMLPALAADASVLLMQNGMGSQDEVAGLLGGRGCYAASSTEGANRPVPTRVVHAGRGLTRIGRLQGEAVDWVERFRAAGLAAEAAEPISGALADKLRVNALINGLTVLFDCRNGELLERPEARRWMAALGEEADRLLGAAGFVFPVSALARAEAVCRSTAANYSSMHQDARAGRRLELGYINGWLVAEAARRGLAAPANEALIERLTNDSGV